MDEDEYDYEINAMKSIKGLTKEEVREIIFLTDEQITIIINKLIEKKKYQRALYLSLSYDSAARRNEVVQIEKHGFLEANKANQVVGKRGKKNCPMYFSRTKEIAKLYFEQRGKDNIDSLWVSGSGENIRPAKYESIYDWCRSFRNTLYKETGELKDINPHCFRHSALENYENGTHYVLKELGKDKLELKVLKVLANHSDISTTQAYLRNKDEEILAEAFGI